MAPSSASMRVLRLNARSTSRWRDPARPHLRVVRPRFLVAQSVGARLGPGPLLLECLSKAWRNGYRRGPRGHTRRPLSQGQCGCNGLSVGGRPCRRRRGLGETAGARTPRRPTPRCYRNVRDHAGWPCRRSVDGARPDSPPPNFLIGSDPFRKLSAAPAHPRGRRTSSRCPLRRRLGRRASVRPRSRCLPRVARRSLGPERVAR